MLIELIQENQESKDMPCIPCCAMGIVRKKSQKKKSSARIRCVCKHERWLCLVMSKTEETHECKVVLYYSVYNIVKTILN